MDINYLKENNIDIETSLKLLGDIEMYNETLEDFLTENEERLPNLEKYKNASDTKNYSIIVHAIKSDSKYLGFTKLAELAFTHQEKSEENDIDYINNNYQELINEINNITNIIKKYLKKC